MAFTPEELKEKRKTRTLPSSESSDMTILATTLGKIYAGAKIGEVTGYTKTIRVVNVNNIEDTFDLPLLRPAVQVSLYGCESYADVAERLSRLGPEVDGEWVKKIVEKFGTPIFFATKHGVQGFQEGENEWLYFRSYVQATHLDEARFNRWLKKQGSKYRIVRKHVVLREA